MVLNGGTQVSVLHLRNAALVNLMFDEKIKLIFYFIYFYMFGWMDFVKFIQRRDYRGQVSRLNSIIGLLLIHCQVLS